LRGLTYVRAGKWLSGMALSGSIGNHDAACEASAAIVCVGLDLETKIAVQRFAAVDLRLLTPATETMPDLPAGCRGLVSFGVAAALSPELRSGDIILASQVIGKTEVMRTDDVWSSWLLWPSQTQSMRPLQTLAK
jgi:hypothetical protein